jgi:hypothetical protein
MLPKAFRRLETLCHVNNVAVGAALAACTGTVFSSMAGGREIDAVTALPTLVFATLWTALLRNEKMLGNTNIRLGWVLSIPLAAANAAVAAAIMVGMINQIDPGDMVLGALMGLTIGAIYWLPALLLTLLCFGVPIAWSQRLAKAGLAGAERGERVVGAVSLLFSLGALAAHVLGAVPKGTGAALALANLGVVLGAVTTGMAHARELRRRSFVADVEAGKLPQYRVDPTPEGKVLVRVAHQQDYRVANIDEELVLLDAEGAATELKQMARPE